MKAIEIRDHAPEGKRRSIEPAKVKTDELQEGKCLGIGWKGVAVLVALTAVVGWYAGISVAKEVQVIEVKQGDTLWSIAEQHKKDDEDVREVYYNIMTANGIGHNEDIYPGQTLVIKR